MKESSVTCSFLARVLDVVESLVIVSGIFISDDLAICETGWTILFFSLKISYKHSFCGSLEYFFVSPPPPPPPGFHKNKNKLGNIWNLKKAENTFHQGEILFIFYENVYGI